MFKNQFQGGSHLDVFVASGKDPKLKVNNVEREFNRDVKGYVYTVSGSTTSAKFQFPLKDAKHSTLSLNQRYLVFQIFLPSSRDFAVEFSVTDVGNNKRRVHMSTSIRDASKSALHFKLPLANIIKRETWLNLCFDLISLASEIVPIQAYRSLDAFTLSGSFKLRRIFTMKCQPHDTCGDDLAPMVVGGCTNIPQNLQFNATLPTATQVINLDRIKSSIKSSWSSSSRNPETSGYWSSSSEDLHASRTRLHSSRDQQQRHSTHIAFGTKVPFIQPRARNSASASTQNIVGGRKADSADLTSARGGGGGKNQQATSGRTPRGEQLLQTRSADPIRRGGGKRSVVPLPTAAISPPSIGGDERLLKMMDEMEVNSVKPRVFTFSAQPRSAPRHRSESTSTASTNDFSRSDDDEDVAGDETSISRRVSRNTPSPSVAAVPPHRRFMMAMSKPVTSSQSPDIPPLLTTASTKYDSGKYDPAPPPPLTAGNKPPALQHQATTSLLNRVSIRSSSATLTASVNTLVQNSTCFDPDDDQQEEDEEKEADISSEPSQVSININRRSVREIEHQPTPTTASTPTSTAQTPAARILESSNFQVGPWSDSLEEEMLLNMKREIENESHVAHDDDDQPYHSVERSKTDYQDNLEDSFDTSWSTYKNPPPMQPQAYDSEMRRNDPFTNTNHNLLTTTMMSSTMNDVQTINNTTTTTNTSNLREWSEDMMMMSSPPPVLPSQRHQQRSSNVLQLELDSMGLSDGSSSIRSATDASDTDDDQMLDLMYDPCLNCYFDPKTGKYYELKN